MSGPAQLAGLGLGRCFEVFKVRAFRLETLSTYAVPAEEEGLRLSGWDCPGRSAR